MASDENRAGPSRTVNHAKHRDKTRERTKVHPNSLLGFLAKPVGQHHQLSLISNHAVAFEISGTCRTAETLGPRIKMRS